MITFSKIDSSTITDAGKRILKFLQFGPKSGNESMPFGVDSNPTKGMTAIFAETSNSGENVIIGYINKNQLAEVGEVRIFSTDANGSLKGFVWCKNDGKVQLNGNDYSSVRFEPLNTALTNQDNLINTELQKIALAITTLGGSYTPATVTTDISNSKSEDVKLK